MTTLVPRQIVKVCDTSRLCYIPYTAQTLLSAIFFFQNQKVHLKGNHYENDDAMESDVPTRCYGNNAEFYADSVQQPVQK